MLRCPCLAWLSEVRFERYVNVMDPSFKVYAPWRDPVLLEEFPGRSQMLPGHGTGAPCGGWEMLEGT